MGQDVARVIGIGREIAGDDGVGPAVVRALQAMGAPPGVAWHPACEPTAIIPLLETTAPVILVDAVVGAAPGQVLVLTPEELEGHGVAPLSSHGVGVVQAIALARILAPDAVTARLHLVGIAIPPPTAAAPRPTDQPPPWLSPPVAAALPLAAQAVLRLLEDAPHA